MDLGGFQREPTADFLQRIGGGRPSRNKKGKLKARRVLFRIGIAAILCLVLGLFAALVWRLTVSYVSRSVDSLCNIYTAETLGRLLDRWQILIGSLNSSLSAYLLLLTPSTGNFSQLYKQAHSSAFQTFKLAGNDSIVNIEKVDGTFISYFTSKSTDLGVAAFNNGSISNSSLSSTFFYSAINDSSGAFIGGALTDYASLSNVTAPLVHLSRNFIGNSSSGLWRTLSDEGQILAVTRDALDSQSNTKWGTVSIGTRLTSVAEAMAETMTKGRISYIVSKDGYLLASSLPEPSGSRILTGQSFLATDSEVVAVKESASQLLKRYQNMGSLLLENASLDIEIGGQRYTIATRPLTSNGLSLVAVLLLPVGTCNGGLSRNNHIAVFIISVASCGLFVLSALFIIFHSVTCGNSKSVHNSSGMEILGPNMRVKSETFGDSKTQFMANMSHELRTPMAGIIGLMDILQCDQTLTTDQVEIVSQIRRCAMALLGILNNLLDLSKVEEGKLDLKKEAFDPTSELESLVEMFAVHCTTAGVDVGLDLSDDMPKELIGDCARFRQIFANLLSNSIKFTANGWIWIRGWVLRQGGLEPKSLEHYHQTRNDVTIYFEIEDTGLGIDPSKWETVFEQFVQGDGSSTRSHGGSGLGLSLVRAFVEAMGGEIAILPKGGAGTRIGFHVVLKQTDQSLPPPIGAKPQTLPANFNYRNQIVPLELKKTRILLSIPTGITLSIVSDWLARKGLQASRASSWAETVLSVEEWARGRDERESGHSGNNNKSLKRTSSSMTEVLLVVIDVSFMPGMNKNPPDMAEVKRYLSRLDYFHKKGAEVACLLSPSTPIGIRNELRESLTVYIANKPLYASKLWRLLLCMVKIGEAEDISSETDWKNPLQELHQDMLVAEGTGVSLAVGLAAGSKFESLKVSIPGETGGGRGEEGMEGGGGGGGGLDATFVTGRRLSESQASDRSGDLIVFSGECIGNPSGNSDGNTNANPNGNPNANPNMMASGPPIWMENQLPTPSGLERMGSSKLHESGRFSGLGGQALLLSGIEIGTEIASMTSRSLPESLVEPYSTPTRRGTTNSTSVSSTVNPRRTTSIPSSSGIEKLQLQAWLQENNVDHYLSEPGLRPRPHLILPHDLHGNSEIHSPRYNMSSPKVSDFPPAVSSPHAPYPQSTTGSPMNTLRRTHSGSWVPSPSVVPSPHLQDLPSFSYMQQTNYSAPASPSPPPPPPPPPHRQAPPPATALSSPSGMSRSRFGFLEDISDPTTGTLTFSPSHVHSSHSLSHSLSPVPGTHRLARTRSGGADIVRELQSYPFPPPQHSPPPPPYPHISLQNPPTSNPFLARRNVIGIEALIDPSPVLSAPPVPYTPPSPSSRSQTPHGISRLGRTRSGNVDPGQETQFPPLSAPASPSVRTQPQPPHNNIQRLARTRSGGMDTVAEAPSLPPSPLPTIPSPPVVPTHRSVVPVEAQPHLPFPNGNVLSDMDQIGPLHGMHILVAEDTPILRRLAVTLLEKLGAHVVAVNDGQAALEAVLATHKKEKHSVSPPFDAVVMDCQMPRLDGYSATEAIRAAEKPLGVHLPIIALTAHAMASDEARCLGCGMDGYLTKPANKVSLVQTLKKFVKVRDS